MRIGAGLRAQLRREPLRFTLANPDGPAHPVRLASSVEAFVASGRNPCLYCDDARQVETDDGRIVACPFCVGPVADPAGSRSTMVDSGTVAGDTVTGGRS